MDEHDRRHESFETSESSTLNAEIVAQLRQELKTKTASEKRLQSELDQTKRDLSAKDKTINARDDTIASKDKALNKSDGQGIEGHIYTTFPLPQKTESNGCQQITLYPLGTPKASNLGQPNHGVLYFSTSRAPRYDILPSFTLCF